MPKTEKAEDGSFSYMEPASADREQDNPDADDQSSQHRRYCNPPDNITPGFMKISLEIRDMIYKMILTTPYCTYSVLVQVAIVSTFASM